jgi:hypothetical protein
VAKPANQRIFASSSRRTPRRTTNKEKKVQARRRRRDRSPRRGHLPGQAADRKLGFSWLPERERGEIFGSSIVRSPEIIARFTTSCFVRTAPRRSGRSAGAFFAESGGPFFPGERSARRRREFPSRNRGAKRRCPLSLRLISTASNRSPAAGSRRERTIRCFRPLEIDRVIAAIHSPRRKRESETPP